MSDDALRMRKARLWKKWKAEPAAKRWSPSQVEQAERLLELAMDAENVASVRERRLLNRELRAGEARLGLGKPVPDEDGDDDVRPEPREVELRAPDLRLLYPEGSAQFVHPAADEMEWPSLGPQVVRWIEANLCHGPGSLRGQPARVSDEWLAFITRAYQLYPQGHEYEGQRRFREVGVVRRKGTAKTEVAAWLVVAEMHPDAPARFGGWDGDDPVGVGVVDPRVFLLATTEQQSSALTYSAVQAVIKSSPTIRDDFRVTDAFLMRADGSGLCEPVTGSPSSRDGERTTLNVFDEGHRLVGPRLTETVDVMQANLPKRTDSWSLMTTTGWEPGMDSYAETEDRRARDGEARSFFYLHRQARDGYDLTDRAQALEALEEASGPEAWAWMDQRGAVMEWEGTRDRAYWERVHLCRSVASSTQAFPMRAVLAAARPTKRVSRERARSVLVGGYGVQKRRGEEVVFGFDGSRFRDHTALIGCTLGGFLFTEGIFTPEGGRIDAALVNSTLHAAFDSYDVRLFLGDDSGWAEDFARWAGQYGRVIKKFQKNTETPYAVRNLIAAFEGGEATYDGREVLTGELANARRRPLPGTFPDGSPKFTISKGQDRTRKIDGAMAATIAWEARRVVLAQVPGTGPKVPRKADDYPHLTTHGGIQ